MTKTTSAPARGIKQAIVSAAILKHGIKTTSTQEAYTKALEEASKNLIAKAKVPAKDGMKRARQIANWMFRNEASFKEASARLTGGKVKVTSKVAKVPGKKAKKAAPKAPVTEAQAAA